MRQRLTYNTPFSMHKKSDKAACPCRPRGRPPGSKNRKTLLKEAGLLSDDPNSIGALENHPLLAPPPAKKRGRPPGSKNKKTLEGMQMKAEGTQVEAVTQPADPVPEEAVTVAAAASGILEPTPRMPPSPCIPLSGLPCAKAGSCDSAFASVSADHCALVRQA